MIRNELTAMAVKNAKEGKHRDGQGLTLEIKGGSKRWTFSYSWDGRQRELPLGRYPAMTLAEARIKRDELRDAKKSGVDPKTMLAGHTQAPSTTTFRDSMMAFYEHRQRTWVPRHRKIWLSSLANYAADLLDKPTASITEEHVVKLLAPIWETTHETADRVLRRIGQILGDAAEAGSPNPCARVRRRLPLGCESVVRPRAAMPWRELPPFFAELRSRDETAARALQLLLLGCCPRAGEVIPAKWSEIEADRWQVPREHMKSGVGRAIPLTQAARDLLSAIKPIGVRPDAPIFAAGMHCPSGRIGDHAMQVLLRDKMGLTYTVHGFRSSFMDWVAEAHPERWLAAERALDHSIGNKVTKAYMRTDLLEQRRELAQLWAAHLLSD